MSVYRLAGRVGGYSRAAKYDGSLMTAAARERFIESFLRGHECRVCPRTDLAPDLLPMERARRAEALRRAHYARIALASSRSRANNKARPERESGRAIQPAEIDADRPSLARRDRRGYPGNAA